VDGREKSEVNLWPVAEFERESHSVVAWDSDREREGILHVGQKCKQVRCPTVFDISIEQHSTHENTTQCGKQEGHKPCPMVGAIMLALERPHTKELSKTKA
jgi:hypothetical protein